MNLIIIIRSLITSLVSRQSWGIRLKDCTQIKYKEQCPHFELWTGSTFFSLFSSRSASLQTFLWVNGSLRCCDLRDEELRRLTSHYSIARVRIDWNVFKALIEHIVRTEQRKNNNEVLFTIRWRNKKIIPAWSPNKWTSERSERVILWWSEGNNFFIPIPNGE